MSDVPARIEKTGDVFKAHVLGAPDWSVTSATRRGVIDELRNLMAQKVASGELAFVPFATELAAVAGLWRDDPTAQEMVDEIYRARDEDRAHVCAELDREEAARAN